MKFRTLLAIPVGVAILAGCATFTHATIEALSEENRAQILEDMDVEKLCSGYNREYVGEKTERAIERVLLTRGISRCVAHGKTREIRGKPSQTTVAVPVPATTPASSRAKRNTDKPSSAFSLTPKGDLTDPQTVSRAVRTTHDEFRGTTLYEGPNVSADVTFDEDPLWAVRLRAGMTKGGAAHYQIYVKDSYVGPRWPDYNEAYDSRSVRLTLRKIDREVKNCTRECLFTEEVAINLSLDYLERARESGIKFRVYGSNRGREFLIPAGYVQGFLKAVQSAARE